MHGYTPGTEKDKDSRWHGAKVHTYEANDYEKMQLFLQGDKSAGFALKGGKGKGKEIVSVFKHDGLYKEDIKGKKAMVLIMDSAIHNGGTHLDCFEPMLPRYYSQFGFVPVARTKFDPNYAPEKWNFERDKHPDIVFMAHDPTQPKRDARTAAQWYESQIDKVPYVPYEEGAQKQQEFLDKSQK